MYGALLDFTFNNAEQKYDAFLAHPYWANKYKLQKNASDLKYMDLIEKYKIFFKKNKKAAFDDEIYKWKLLTLNKGKVDVDLINAVRTSNNLIYQSDAATLKTLVEQVPYELIQIVNNLLNESSDLIIRLDDFRNDMKSLVQKNLTSTNYAEDERTAADYLTYSYPEKYTFYTNEVYNAYCNYLEIEKRKTGEIYPHYCELLHKLESFVSKDDELLEMIANNSSNYIQSDLLLSQNIVYVMLKEKYLSQINEGDSMLDKLNEYKTLLLNTHNLILHGAPGTGKTHLAKDIASFMHYQKKYEDLTDTEKKDLKDYIGFVQFHPSYDYTDFVEGLRPVNDNNGEKIGFERKDGVFKEFCGRALKNLNDSNKTTEQISKEISIDEKMESFLSTAIDENKEFNIVTGNKFFVTDFNEKNIYISIPENEKVKELVLQRLELSSLLNSEDKIENGTAVREFFNRKWRTQQDSYVFALYKEIKQKASPVVQTSDVQKIEKKNFIFIIDEINRGEMSKIFGELFFSIDPGYRGKDGLIQTQYQNLVPEGDTFSEGFYVPENVYIIGTMNDIDRNVESMDFAFRRRFTFKEIKATDTQQVILAGLDDSIKEEAINRMNSLNDAISNIEGLSSAYHIGGAYFLKLKDLDNDFGKLWDYHLEGLLREYLRGMENTGDELNKLKKAYENDNFTGGEPISHSETQEN